MFSKRPAYSTQDLDAAVSRIERLTALQEKAESMWRLTKQTQYKDAYDRLTQNVATSQIYYQRITEKASKV